VSKELTVNAWVRFQKGDVDVSLGKNGLRLDMSGDDYMRFEQLVGITEEALILGDVTPGVVLIKNLDNTNFVSLRRASGEGNCLKIKAGECWPFRLAAAAPFVIADTAPVRIEVLIIDD
jgi:hypothetical protein